MVVLADALFPMSEPALDPIWQRLADSLTHRADLIDVDLRLQTIVAKVISASTQQKRGAYIYEFLMWISYDRRLLYRIFRDRGITAPETIEELIQDTFEFYMCLKLPTVNPAMCGSVTGSCRNYLGFAAKDIARKHHVRIKKNNQHIFRPVGSEGELMKTIDGIECPTLSGLKGMLMRDRQLSVPSTTQQWAKFVESGESSLLSYHHPDCPACSVREVLYRYRIKQPPDSLEVLAREFQIDYQSKFYPFYRRHILPRGQALFLEPEVLTGAFVTQAIDEINYDFDRVLQKSLKSRMPLVTVQFVAQYRLWFFHLPPLSFEEIANIARLQFGYQKITAAELADFWQDKCQQVLAKIAANIILG